MTLEIKDEWVEAAEEAYDTHCLRETPPLLADLNYQALRAAIEAIAPAIYETGRRAGLEEAADMEPNHD